MKRKTPAICFGLLCAVVAAILLKKGLVTCAATAGAGSTWVVQKSPSPSNQSLGNVLYGVSAVSASDAFAVGTEGNNLYALIERWNGTSWSVMKNTGSCSLSAVAAVSGTDVWAVGNCQGVEFIEHWNGTAWSVIPAPDPPCANGDSLDGVTAIASTDVWAVGQASTSSYCGSGDQVPFAMH